MDISGTLFTFNGVPGNVQGNLTGMQNIRNCNKDMGGEMSSDAGLFSSFLIAVSHAIYVF